MLEPERQPDAGLRRPSGLLGWSSLGLAVLAAVLWMAGSEDDYVGPTFVFALAAIFVGFFSLNGGAPGPARLGLTLGIIEIALVLLVLQSELSSYGT